MTDFHLVADGEQSNQTRDAKDLPPEALSVLVATGYEAVLPEVFRRMISEVTGQEQELPAGRERGVPDPGKPARPTGGDWVSKLSSKMGGGRGAGPRMG